jgi:protein O-mannosyl-transferase
MSHRTKDIAMAAALVLLTALAFSGVTRLTFIILDDPHYIYFNPHVRAGLSWSEFRWAMTSFEAANWHPLTWLSLQADVSFWGRSHTAMHVTNAALHAGAVALCFFWLRVLGAGLWMSAATAALFAVHPLRVESVAWVAERKDVLSVFLAMGTLLAYCWPFRSGGSEKRAPDYLLVGTLFTLALMAKPMVVSLPILMLLLDYWPLGRLPAEWIEWPIVEKWRAAKGLIREKAFLFFLVACSSVLTIIAQRKGGAINSLDNFPFLDRLANALVTLVEYPKDLLYPVGLIPFYPLYPGGPELWMTLLSLVLVGAFVRWAYQGRLTHPHRWVGGLWYLVTLLPVIGILHVGSQAKADRYTYLPSLGLLLVAAWEANRLSLAGRKIALGVAVAAIAVCVPLTRAQTDRWRNTVTLFRYAVGVDPWNPTVSTFLCGGWVEAGYIEEAEACSERTMAVLKKRAESSGGIIDSGPLFDLHIAMGHAYLKATRAQEALKQYEAAQKLNATHYQVLNGLAVAYLLLERYEDSAAMYIKTIELGHLDDDFTAYSTVLERLREKRLEAKREELLSALKSALLRRGLIAEARALEAAARSPAHSLPKN